MIYEICLKPVIYLFTEDQNNSHLIVFLQKKMPGFNKGALAVNDSFQALKPIIWSFGRLAYAFLKMHNSGDFGKL